MKRGGDLHHIAKALDAMPGKLTKAKVGEICRNLNNRAMAKVATNHQTDMGITHAKWLYSGATCMLNPRNPSEADIAIRNNRRGSMFAQRDGLLGWATGRLVFHDNIAPGVIRRLLTSGPMFRQSVFALVAHELAAERHHQITGGEDADILRRKAATLRDGRAKEVIAFATCGIPDGLLPALERIGLDPFKSPTSYQRLVQMFTDPAMADAAAALRNTGTTTENMVRCIGALPDWLVTPEVLKRLENLPDAFGFATAVNFTQCVNSVATRQAILGAIEQMGEETTLPEVISRFIQRADKPLAEPLAADDEVTPIRTCAEMAATSREFNNCLGLHQKLTGALHGRMAYAVFRGEVVMEFGGLSDGSWVYMGCHGKENGLVEPHLSRAAEAKCDAAGIPHVKRSPRASGAFRRVLADDDVFLLDLAA